MQDLVASTGEVADCNQLITPPLTLPFPAGRRTYDGYETCEKPVFSLYILGYCRNMARSVEDDHGCIITAGYRAVHIYIYIVFQIYKYEIQNS